MNSKAIIARQFEILAEKIVALPSDGPLLVGIDGIPASGKTTLADRLAPLVRDLGRPVARASIDGFHNPADIRHSKGKDSPEGYYADSFNYDALVEVLLGPLSNMPKITDEGLDLPTAVYDFRENSVVTDRHARFEPETIMLFDGVMLFRDEINRYWDYRIYVDVRYQTGFIRGVPRDAMDEEDQMVVGKKYLNRYFPGDAIYRATANPQAQADATVLNDDPETCMIKYRKS